jgi:hypothetical protein
MIGHMFDPAYPPADSTHAVSIDSIHATLTITSAQPDSSGGSLVSTHAVIQVMYNATSGARSDVFFDLHLVPHDGHLLVREIHELPNLGQSTPGVRVEPTTWARLKAMYR